MSTGKPEPRNLVMIVVDVSWEDEEGALKTARARIEDKSTGGACIRLKRPIALGSRLRIQWRYDQFSGTVKYCRGDGGEYLVGLQRDRVPISDYPVPPGVASRQEAIRSVAATNIDVPPPRQESKPREIPERAQEVETAAAWRSATLVPSLPPVQIENEIVRQRVDDWNRIRTWLPQEPEALRQTKVRTEQTPEQKEPENERKNMSPKWLGLAPWNSRQENLSSGDDDNGKDTGNNRSRPEHPVRQTQSVEKSPQRSARELPPLQIELLSMEDIYRAAGITNPRGGYSVNKVVEMLDSEHIRVLSKDLKRAALMMALDAAGISIDLLQRDAQTRRNALDFYEAEQQRQAEAQWSRKAEEVSQIRAELETAKEQYTTRINRNLESVAREKARFSSWVAAKHHETQSMAEAIELCLKSPVSERANALPSEVTQAAMAA